ncbi:MAG: tetratricopeptide repeat protein [Bacteroidetes bacterium]|nr:tetratricopeptide repeat protein [Bacteroidota bacterium]
MGKKGTVQTKSFLSGKQFTWLALVLIVVAGLAFYSNSFKGVFVFDDLDTIMHNKTVVFFDDYQSSSFWLDINNRPLSFLTFAVNYSIHYYQPWGYHLVNLIIHILASFVVFLLARTLFTRVNEKPDWNADVIRRNALFVALIFLLHPLQTMGVTYVVQRMTSLAALFYLLAVYLYMQGRLLYFHGKGSYGRAVFYIVLAVFSGILAILSKQNAITFPLAFMFAELYFIRNNEGKPARKLLISAFIVFAATFITVMTLGLIPMETTDISRPDYLLTQFKVMLKYIQLLFVPAWQNIDHNITVSSAIGLMEIAGMLVVAGLIVAACLLFKKFRIISFGIVWFLLALSVESSIIPIRDVIMEHRLYLPLFGFALIVTDGLYRLIGKYSSTYFNIAFVAILLILGLLAYNRNKLYQSPRMIWEDSLSKNPDNPRGLVNLGVAYIGEKDYKSALIQYNKAIRIDSTYDMAYLNRGIALFDLGGYDYAVKDLDKVLEKRKKLDVAFFFRGVSYGHLKKYDLALQDLTRTIQLNPQFPEAHKNRGVIYEITHNYPEALDDFNKAMELNPANVKLLINRSKSYFMMRQFREALEDIKQAQRIGLEVDQNYIRNIEERLERGEDTIQYFKIRNVDGEGLDFEGDENENK